MSAEPLDRRPLPLVFSTSEPTPPIEFSGPQAYPTDVVETLRPQAEEIVARYPQSRSALLPLLHLVQSVDGYLTRAGIRFCADQLRLTTAQVASVATFYTMYRLEPTGDYLVGVCTNTLCAVMGGDSIAARLTEKVGVEDGQTTEDGAITVERIECNAACDHAPVVMVNWEFFDEQTPESVDALVDDLRAGKPPAPSRGASSLCTFRQTARLLAGLPETGDAS
ncbi:NADH-quinone oxidoreductase subunit NuoE [Gordonia sp. HY002]|uniref:NADH-quinone oxidoreductase subunit NuoE n=1 Tax=Gordonia zhenghanii TaxID=2911516 RepID=UPI001EEF9930|nr:NADH-quinone oxidoreductase subunit NuoE [Gordonia zhenghanii]MCF8569432.1 NADH-quinone oxidoreductase subunit NuoE [Gordonia zhenghanii]MCF8602397.1 NADH-quinone oxidoreductase subunit NuoE [Gordonia zhenghanii]